MKFNKLTGNSPQEIILMKKSIKANDAAIIDLAEAVQDIIDSTPTRKKFTFGADGTSLPNGKHWKIRGITYTGDTSTIPIRIVGDENFPELSEDIGLAGFTIEHWVPGTYGTPNIIFTYDLYNAPTVSITTTTPSTGNIHLEFVDITPYEYKAELEIY